MMNQQICVICKKQLEKDEFVNLGEKGSAGINKASEERGDTIITVAGQRVHKICRRDYCLAQNILGSKRQATQPGEVQSIRRPLERKAESSFSFKTDCFYCGTEIKFDEKKGATSAFKVTILEIKDTVLEICSKRGNDSWAEIVRGRLLHVHDLPAADAMYHQVCSVNFRTEKQIPKMYAKYQPECKRGKIGRPKDEEKFEAFISAMNFLKENDDEQITLRDREKKMQEYLGDSEATAYSHTHLKAKIEEYFGDQIILTEINGKHNVVTFRSTAENILNEFHAANQKSVDQESEKLNIIKAAARLIKNDIKAITASNDKYPIIDGDLDTSLISFLPISLILLMEGILHGKDSLKLASIGQAIIQAA